MATSKLEQAIYLANNLPQGEYDVDSWEVSGRNPHATPNQRQTKTLVEVEYDTATGMDIDEDYEQLMASGAEIIRHLLGLLVRARAVLGVDYGYDLDELYAELAALDDYDPQP